MSARNPPQKVIVAYSSLRLTRGDGDRALRRIPRSDVRLVYLYCNKGRKDKKIRNWYIAYTAGIVPRTFSEVAQLLFPLALHVSSALWLPHLIAVSSLALLEPVEKVGLLRKSLLDTDL